ncbi:MAG: hypothetical protein HO274_12275 [Ferrovum myxofaciens]|uniref:hypothetical protein n=1 Tax=Ferrovum myxofaciens TaxID=416213 RepID=UPI002357661D|nr:hypothetical protein [Ferrovum myxofaciens]QKE41988.1 MAG: hypothetical protein HO274_12275 [Ferrovum myxofaciens]
MCGYCIEAFALDVLQVDVEDKEPAQHLHAIRMRLQEEKDLPKGLRYIPESLLTDIGMGLTVICRAIEILIKEGFASAQYQALLVDPAFKVLITTACNFSQSRILTPEQDIAPMQKLRWLYDSNIYFIVGGFAECDHVANRQACTEILELYKSDVLGPENQLHQNPEIIENNTNFPMGRRHDENPNQQINLSGSDFALVWYSFLHATRHGYCPSLSWYIVTHEPKVAQLPFAFELWLQRRASSIHYDQYGITPFVQSCLSVREGVFKFLALDKIRNKSDQHIMFDCFAEHGILEQYEAKEWHWTTDNA